MNKILIIAMIIILAIVFSFYYKASCCSECVEATSYGLCKDAQISTGCKNFFESLANMYKDYSVEDCK